MDYKNFNAEDFSSDEHFVQWVKRPNTTNNLFWKKWMTDNPEKEPEITAARNIVESIQFHIEEPTEEQILRMQKNIHKKINAPKTIPIKRRNLFLRMAATFLVLVGAYMFIKFGIDHRIYHQTVFGETKDIALPGGSEIILNANSKIYFPKNWDEKTAREIWLEGEAYFKINSRPAIGSAKFVVHAGEVDVAVLGTQFNVRHRGGEVDVVLAEGKIELTAPHTEKKEMNPGEIIEYSPENQSVSTNKINPDIYTSWTDRRLVFDQTPLARLVEIIEENYGETVEVEDVSLLEKKLSGTLPNENLDLMLAAVSTVFDLEINRGEGGIFIRQP